MALTVSHCCCGCSLRLGTRIIAIYLLFCSMGLILFSSVMLDSLSKDGNYHRQNIRRYNMLHLRSDREMKVAFVSGIVGGILLTILNTLLLVGVHKEKKSLVSIWLGAYVVVFVLNVLLLVFSFFQFYANPYSQVGVVISIGLIMYFLLVVRSYHQSLADGHSRQQNAANVYHTENSNIKRIPLA